MPLVAYAFLLSAALVWGGAFVAGRVLVAGIDPLAVAWLRFAIASLALAVLELRWRRDAPARVGSGGRSPSWRDYALLGLTGIFAYNLFFFYGLTLTGATESSLIIASSPVVVAVIGVLFLREPLTWRKSAGILLSVAGVVVIVLAAPPATAGPGTGPGTLGGAIGRGSQRLLGDLLMLGAVLSWAAYSALGKRLLREVSPQAATARSVWWGTLFLTAAAGVQLALTGRGQFLPLAAFGAAEWAGMLYLSLVCTVFGFVAWYRGLAEVEVSRASVFLNLVPLSTLVFAAALLRERPAWLQLAGGLLVLGGVYTVGATARAAKGGAGSRGAVVGDGSPVSSPDPG